MNRLDELFDKYIGDTMVAPCRCKACIELLLFIVNHDLRKMTRKVRVR